MSTDPVADERDRAIAALTSGAPARRRMLVRIVPVHAGRVLVVRRSIDDDWLPGHWQLVCGSVEEAEAPLGAALRELDEQVGLAPGAERLITCGTGSFLLHRPARGVVEDWGNVNFLAAVPDAQSLRLGPELSEAAWLSAAHAARRLAEPSDREALAPAISLGTRAAAIAMDASIHR